jgi:hypothetical protein
VSARPIFGGKVVIQAERYKNTVGVWAVRDLFGTLQNEGASNTCHDKWIRHRVV